MPGITAASSSSWAFNSTLRIVSFCHKVRSLFRASFTSFNCSPPPGQALPLPRCKFNSFRIESAQRFPARVSPSASVTAASTIWRCASWMSWLSSGSFWRKSDKRSSQPGWLSSRTKACSWTSASLFCHQPYISLTGRAARIVPMRERSWSIVPINDCICLSDRRLNNSRIR